MASQEGTKLGASSKFEPKNTCLRDCPILVAYWRLFRNAFQREQHLLEMKHLNYNWEPKVYIFHYIYKLDFPFHKGGQSTQSVSNF